MKICITLDDVLRAKTRQIGKMLVKAGNIKEEDLPTLDISTTEFWKVFGFETKDKYNRFLYEDYAFEVFAEAPVMEKMLDKKLNLWMLSLSDEEDIEFVIANPYEFNASIGFTCFFLSQVATRVREFHFPANSSEIWDTCDVLITADPKLLAEKPEGKKTVKVNAPYNENSKADVTYETLAEIIEDEKFLEKLNGNIH